MPIAGLRAALVAVLLLVGWPVFAQTGGAVAFLSDYRYRGVSLSDEKPTLRLDVAHDAANGWYAGGSLIGVAFDPPRHQLQWLAYIGHAGRWSERLGWEAGANIVHFGADSRFDYHEWFAGLQGERWVARVYYAPNYFGSGTRTAYAELNLGMPLSRFARATVHAGALLRVGGDSAGDAQRLHVDASLGYALACDAWRLQAELVAASRSGIYPVAYGRVRGVLVFSASHPY